MRAKGPDRCIALHHVGSVKKTFAEVYVGEQGVMRSASRILEDLSFIFSRCNLLYGPALGAPYTKALGDGLFEIRAKEKEGIARSFFCTLVGQEVVILHSFIKKTQKIPQKEMKIARNRLKEVKQ